MISSENVYTRQRLALAPFTTGFSQEKLLVALYGMSGTTKGDFLTFLRHNNLTTVWLEKIGHVTLTKILSEEQFRNIRLQAISATVNYIRQKTAIQQFTEKLDQRNIPHLIFKGAHTRELVYKNPAARPSCDIDLLIAEKDRGKVVHTFSEMGYSLHALRQNLNHEISLNSQHASIDLHWHILRPGRVPMSFTGELLERRTRQDNYWCCSDTHSLFILLVHSIFSKYSLMTETGLIRMLDLLNWFRSQPVDWQQLEHLLTRTGLKTAAWLTLSYLELFTDEPALKTPMERLAPGRLKKLYLRKWLETNLAAGLQQYPWTVKIAYTLFAHDSAHHSVNFLRTFLTNRLKSISPY